MFENLFRARYKRECDMADANNLIDKHGSTALTVAKERAADDRLSMRNRSHWRRIAKLVAKIEKEEREGSTLMGHE